MVNGVLNAFAYIAKWLREMSLLRAEHRMSLQYVYSV